jgi:penicillin G amidase
MIEARTASGGLHDVASFAQIQTDTYSSHLVRLRDLLLARHLVEDALEPMLRGWDGQLSAESAAGALASVTYRLLITDCAERIAGGMAPVLLGQAVHGVPVNSAFAYRAQGAVVAAAEGAIAPWFEDELDRDRRVRGAASRAGSLLRTRSSADPARWRLGDVQRWPAHHAFDGVPGLGRLFSRGDRPFGGDVNTLVQGQSTLWTETATVRIAPGYRQVVDLEDWDRSVFMVPTGNNGIPGHPRYDDCIDEYVAGTYRPLLFSREAVEAAAEAWLVLEREDSR